MEAVVTTVALNKDNFHDTVTSNHVVLIDFWATWCGPCRMFSPLYEAAAEDHPDVPFAKPMQLPETVTAEVRRRLRRVTRQVQGIERMLAEGLTYGLERPDEARADGYDIDTVQRIFMRLA